MEVPWSVVLGIVNRLRWSSKSRTAPSTPRAERTERRLSTSPRIASSPKTPAPKPPVVVPSQKASDRLQASRRSPRRTNVAPEAGPSRVVSDRAEVSSTSRGRVKARVDAFNAASTGDPSRARTAVSAPRSKAVPASKRNASGSSETTRQPTRARARATDKPANAQPAGHPEARAVSRARPPSASLTRDRPTETHPRSHTAKVQSALQALPPAPTHDPQQSTDPRPEERAAVNTQTANAVRPARRNLKRTRASDEDPAAQPSRSKSTPAKSTPTTKRPARTVKSTIGKTDDTQAARTKRTRSSAAEVEDASPRVKRARTRK